MKLNPRRLQLVRHEDDRVQTEQNGHASYPGGIDGLIEVHGHGGRTEVVWVDSPTNEESEDNE